MNFLIELHKKAGDMRDARADKAYSELTSSSGAYSALPRSGGIWKQSSTFEADQADLYHLGPAKIANDIYADKNRHTGEDNRNLYC